ncbi:MAG: MFS transporter [Dongiaceae bacterium]
MPNPPTTSSQTAIELTSRERFISLTAAIGGVLGVGFAFGAAIPLITLLMEARGYSPLVIGLNGSMFPLAVLIVAPFVPKLLGRFGTLRMMAIVLALGIAMLMVFPATDSIALWFLARFVMGFTGAVHWITTEAWINTMAGDKNRGRIMGFYASALGIGFAGGPALLKLVGFDGWMPFLCIGACLVLAAAPLLFARGLAPSMSEHPDGGALRTLLKAPTVLAASVAAGAIDSGLYLLLPIYAVDNGFDREMTATWLIVWIAGTIFMQPPLGWLVDKFDARRMLVVISALVMAGMIALPYLWGGGIVFWIVTFLWGGVVLGIYTVGIILLGRRFRGPQIAAANAGFVMVYEVGAIAGPVAVGASMDWYGSNGMVPVVVGMCAIFMAIAIWRIRVGRARDRAATPQA